MNTLYNLREYFSKAKATKDYNGYSCSIERVLLIVVLGSLCGLRNAKLIHRWASSEKTKEFFKEHLGICTVPCYSWFMKVLNIIDPQSLNQCFIKWAKSILPESLQGLVVSFDGKTIRSTGKMKNCNETIHIVNAHVASLGLTIGQMPVKNKSNEIPAVRELIKLLDVSGCIIVADALNCQKKTCDEILSAGADFLLVVKDNQPQLMEAVETHMLEGISAQAFQEDSPIQIDSASTMETNRGRLELRTAYTSDNIDLIPTLIGWPSIACVGAINRQTIRNGKASCEMHYYISSKCLSAEELLQYARDEWSVESMHWLLDVHFLEDGCRIEDVNGQKNMSLIRKVALNIIKDFKVDTNCKTPISNIMLDCLVDSNNLINVLRG